MAGIFHKTNCSVFLTYALMKDDNTYTIHVDEGRDLGVARSDKEAFVAAYQREHNDVISSWIRRYPEHYFGWFHRRFKGKIAY